MYEHVCVCVFILNIYSLSELFGSCSKGLFKNIGKDFPGGSVVKNPPANAGDMGSSPGLGKSHMLWSN